MPKDQVRQANSPPKKCCSCLPCDGFCRLTAFGGTGADAPRESPEKYGRPISHWTSTELAEEMEKQKIVETISPRHVARLLSEATLKPHQSEYWLNPPPTKNLTKKSKISVNYTSKQSK
ncbi:MAG: hypothetical protein AAFR77_06570 [Cyanobacteria bacterium J06631_2]